MGNLNTVLLQTISKSKRKNFYIVLANDLQHFKRCYLHRMYGSETNLSEIGHPSSKSFYVLHGDLTYTEYFIVLYPRSTMGLNFKSVTQVIEMDKMNSSRHTDLIFEEVSRGMTPLYGSAWTRTAIGKYEIWYDPESEDSMKEEKLETFREIGT